MGACANGAVATPAGEDLQVWVDRLQLPLDVIAILTEWNPLGWAAIVASLIDINQLCEDNPDTPEPFTVQDVLEQTASTVSGGAFVRPAVVDKAYAWVRYAAFLNYCVCRPPALTPGRNCTAPATAFTLPSLNSVGPELPITVDQSLLDTWALYPNGDWQMSWSGSATVTGAATTGNDLNVELRGSDGIWWDTTIDIQSLNADPDSTTFDFQVRTRRPGTSTAVRVRNRAGGSYTVTNFVWCFEPVQTFAPPLPVQPPFTGVPTPPALNCGSEDLCAMVSELARQVTRIAAQVSDIQASLIGRDELVILNSQAISGEGEATLVLGTRAVSVELTALGPEAYTSALGRPRGLMRVGSIRYGDGIGYSPRRFIDADRFDDPIPAGALSLSWQLLPGTFGNLRFLG